MSRPFFSVRYIPDRANLPDKLERGRAYFIGDEQIIIVDYGNGPIEYGGKPGPQGAPGEPQPQLQGQIDYLADASLETTNHLWNLMQKIRACDEKIKEAKEYTDKKAEDLQEYAETTSENLQRLQADKDEEIHALIENNSEAILELVSFMHAKFEKINNVLSIVVKLLASLYPDADIDMNPEEPHEELNTLSKNDILSTDSGMYKVRNSYADSDGSVIVILDVIETSGDERVHTLEEGDTVSSEDGGIWTVDYIMDSEGVMTLSYSGTRTLIETLKPGSTVEYDGMKYIVTGAETEDGQGTVRLTPSE